MPDQRCGEYSCRILRLSQLPAPDEVPHLLELLTTRVPPQNQAAGLRALTLRGLELITLRVRI